MSEKVYWFESILVDYCIFFEEVDEQAEGGNPERKIF